MRVPRRRASALLWQSQLLFAAGDDIHAIEKLQEAICEAGSDAGPLRVWCQLMFDRGDLRAAEKGLHSLVQRDPADAAAHHNLGTVYLRMREFANAATECRAALQLRPGFAPSGVHLGYALENLGELREAIQIWHDVLRIEPGNPQALESLTLYEKYES